MAIVSDDIRAQLRARFQERLQGPVRLELFTKPGSGRLILPAGLGCPTCPDARDLAEAIAEAGQDKVTLEVVDVTSQPADGEWVEAVPTLRIGAPGQPARIAYQGLPAGFEFATVVDAVERISHGDAGLSPESITRLQLVKEPIEVMIFTTPT
jgi:hypothetical protein